MMDAWAGKYERVKFICVGCAGSGLALEFVRQLQLRRCVVSFVKDMQRNGPKWGQLGCNGFIILDSSLKVVCPKTSAFLEVRERAFHEVETILSKLLDGKSASTTETKQQGKLDLETGGCGPNGCSLPQNSTTVPPLKPISSVNVDALDDEHAECAEALGRLVKERTPEALEEVISVYAAHFDHEEKLLRQHLGQGRTRSAFSAMQNMLTSHVADHERMLKDLREAKNAAAVLPASFVDAVLRDFENHAERYDGAYAEPLSAAMKVDSMWKDHDAAMKEALDASR